MGEQRQRFNEEFKKQTVKYIQEQTKTLPELATELNIEAKLPPASPPNIKKSCPESHLMTEGQPFL